MTCKDEVYLRPVQEKNNRNKVTLEKLEVMGLASRMYHWMHNQSLYKLIIRVVVGLILILKGIYFISHAGYLREMILQSRFSAGVGFIAAYVTFVHLFGGIFIHIGLFTRLSALLQIPILLGAIFFILPAQGIAEFSFDFMVSLIVLILLFYILRKGPGNISMDYYLKHHLL